MSTVGLEKIWCKQLNLQQHPFHLVTSSPWPIILSVSLLQFVISIVTGTHSFDLVEALSSFIIVFLVIMPIFLFIDELSQFKKKLNYVKNGLPPVLFPFLVVLGALGLFLIVDDIINYDLTNKPDTVTVAQYLFQEYFFLIFRSVVSGIVLYFLVTRPWRIWAFTLTALFNSLFIISSLYLVYAAFFISVIDWFYQVSPEMAAYADHQLLLTLKDGGFISEKDIERIFPSTPPSVKNVSSTSMSVYGDIPNLGLSFNKCVTGFKLGLARKLLYGSVPPGSTLILLSQMVSNTATECYWYICDGEILLMDVGYHLEEYQIEILEEDFDLVEFLVVDRSRFDLDIFKDVPKPERTFDYKNPTKDYWNYP